MPVTILFDKYSGPTLHDETVPILPLPLYEKDTAYPK